MVNTEDSLDEMKHLRPMTPYSEDSIYGFWKNNLCDALIPLMGQTEATTDKDSTEDDLMACVNPLTSSKSLLVFSDASNDWTNDWQGKAVDEWTSSDVIDWISDVTHKKSLNIGEVKMAAFSTFTGFDMMQMDIEAFCSCDQKFGCIIFEEFQEIRRSRLTNLSSNIPAVVQEGYNNNHLPTFDDAFSKAGGRNSIGYLENWDWSTADLDLVDSLKGDVYDYDRNFSLPSNSIVDQTMGSAGSSSESDCESDIVMINPPLSTDTENTQQTIANVKRGPGRPRKPNKRRSKNDKKFGRLWEFIRDLLHNPQYCPSLVKWENHEEGVFRFIQSEKVAKLWGTKKANPRMTYEKLSRAMRYYYKSEVFLPVLGRRLVYKFGPNAVNWRPSNPNFEL